MSSAEAVEDPGSLPGQTLYDHTGRKVGEIQALYTPEDGGEPEWLSVEASSAQTQSDRGGFVKAEREA
jgi:hypothetical protein